MRAPYPHEFTSVQDRIRLIGFRFAFSYLVLYTFAFPFYYIPFSSYILEPIHALYIYLTDSMGSILFKGSYSVLNPETGSGDTSFKYAQAVMFLTLAFVATVAWSIIDRHRSGYPKLSVVLTTLVRYYLAAALIGYGVIKIFPLQFSVLPAIALNRTYGESSPMGLLWTFMGASRLYTAFTGAGELLAGVLLLFRITRLIGATLSTFIFLHVFVLNLSYDVPVKLLSFHLLLMSAFLTAPLMKKTANLFATEEPPLSEVLLPKWSSKRTRWLIITLKCMLIVLILVLPALNAFERNMELIQEAKSSSKPSIYGVYTISNFMRNNETTRDTGPSGWKEIKLNANVMEIVYSDGVTIQWLSAMRSKKLRLASKDLAAFGEFDCVWQGETLLLTGKLNQDSLKIQARQIAPYTAPLLSRGFHWINEDPFNH